MRVLVAGGHGFLGEHLLRELRRAPGAPEVVAPRSRDVDLRDPSATLAAIERGDGIFHLAAIVGGITFNIANGPRLIHDNTAMGLNVLEAARRKDAAWVVLLGSACAYPGDAPVPTPESALWDGRPEASNAPYGIAKRTVTEAGQTYARTYGMRVVNLIPTNLFGPGDHFDPATAHVVPSLVTRFHHAKLQNAPEVVCWGDGTPTRDLLYVEDCAKLVARAPEAVRDAEPVNLGTGQEHSIREIAETIRDVVGFEGALRWDTTKPNGQQRRALSTERMRARFGDARPTALRAGLRATYEHFLHTPWSQPKAVSP